MFARPSRQQAGHAPCVSTGPYKKRRLMANPALVEVENLHPYDCKGTFEDCVKMRQRLARDWEALERSYHFHESYDICRTLGICVLDISSDFTEMPDEFSLRTPLFHACMADHVECVDVLLSEGANVLECHDFVDYRLKKFGSCLPPFPINFPSKFLTILQALIDHGFPVNEKLEDDDIPGPLQGRCKYILIPGRTMKIFMKTQEPKSFAGFIAECLLNNGAVIEPVACNNQNQLVPLSAFFNDSIELSSIESNVSTCNDAYDYPSEIITKALDAPYSGMLNFLLKSGGVVEFKMLQASLGGVVDEYPIAYETVSNFLFYSINENGSIDELKELKMWTIAVQILEFLVNFGDCQFYETVQYKLLVDGVLRNFEPKSCLLVASYKDQLISKRKFESLTNVPKAGETILQLLERRMAVVEDLSLVYDRLKELMQPRSLQSTCRLAIKNSVGPLNYKKKVASLPIASHLKSYLVFEEVPDLEFEFP